MSFSYSPNIVTDGLVLYLDAANVKSYPNTGVTWTDLSRVGTIGTLLNGPTFSSINGGVLTLDGVNDYISTDLSLTPSSVTVEVICSVTSGVSTKTGGNTVANYVLFRQNSRTTTFEGIVIYYHTSGYFNISMSSAAGTNVAVITPTINLNQIYSVTGTYSSSNVATYLNGQFITQSATGFPIDYNATHRFTIGRAAAIGQSFDGYFNGRIYQIRIYNRVLSTSEIQQNYNTLKTRFGLT